MVVICKSDVVNNIFRAKTRKNTKKGKAKKKLLLLKKFKKKNISKKNTFRKNNCYMYIPLCIHTYKIFAQYMLINKKKN